MNARLTSKLAQPDRRTPATAPPSFLLDLLGLLLIVVAIGSVGIATAVVVQPALHPVVAK